MLHDESNVMALGAVWCPEEKVHEINLQIRDLKKQFGLSSAFEIKWTKVSNARVDFYSALVDYFFTNSDLFFRILIVPDKSILRHADFNQDHNDWYYKMYFDMLKIIFDPADTYNIYLDIKDTRSATKITKLHEVLCNNIYDFSREIIKKVQTVRSEEISVLQLADLLIGAITYANRGLTTNPAKLALIEQIRQRSNYKLTESTLFQERKINIFIWESQKGRK
jgi:hypothetical protein